MDSRHNIHDAEHRWDKDRQEDRANSMKTGSRDKQVRFVQAQLYLQNEWSGFSLLPEQFRRWQIAEMYPIKL
jgi:hypothetical protein